MAQTGLFYLATRLFWHLCGHARPLGLTAPLSAQLPWACGTIQCSHILSTVATIVGPSRMASSLANQFNASSARGPSSNMCHSVQGLEHHVVIVLCDHCQLTAGANSRLCICLKASLRTENNLFPVCFAAPRSGPEVLTCFTPAHPLAVPALQEL
jgi:hypothetical protein